MGASSGAFEQTQAEFVGQLTQFGTPGIEPLAHPGATRDLGQTQGFPLKKRSSRNGSMA